MCVHIRPDRPTQVILWTGLIVGLVMLTSAAQPGWGASMVIPPGGWGAEVLIGSTLATGGTLSLTAAHRVTRIISNVWALDELGAWITAGGWTAYTVIAAIAEPWALVHWLISLGLAGTSIARICTIREHRAHTEASVARMHDREAS